MVYGTLLFQDPLIHQIWNSFLKEYRKYAPGTMQFLENRSEVKLTQQQYTTLREDACSHQRNSYLKKYKRNAPARMLKKIRSEVKVTLTEKLYATLRHPKMHLHTKFGIPTSKNIEDMLRT